MVMKFRLLLFEIHLRHSQQELPNTTQLFSRFLENPLQPYKTQSADFRLVVMQIAGIEIKCSSDSEENPLFDIRKDIRNERFLLRSPEAHPDKIRLQLINLLCNSGIIKLLYRYKRHVNMCQIQFQPLLGHL